MVAVNFILECYILIVNAIAINKLPLTINKKIHIIFGPTASGKTEFAINLAKTLNNCEIINADSMQIYREIPIITNQPTEDEKNGIPHHLFSITSILEHSDVAKWLELAVPKINEIQENSKTPILSGGTGLYLKAITEGVSEIPDIPEEIKNRYIEESKNDLESLYDKLKASDPESAEKIKPGDSQRTIRALSVLEHTGISIQEWNKKPNKRFFAEDNFKIYFLNKDREEIYNKINLRFEKMFENGLLEEAKKANELFSSHPASSFQLPSYKAHGLREIISYLNNEITKEEAIEKAQQATRNYAKRQFTWWRNWVKSLEKNKNNIEIEVIS